VNDDGQTNTQLTRNTNYNDVNRSLRSIWLIRYDATDASGNQADTVTFSFTFYDDEKPQLSTSWSTSSVYSTEPFRGAGTLPKTQAYTQCRQSTSCALMANCEACNMGGAMEPCTWYLPRTATATDNYDDSTTVTNRIEIKLASPGQQGTYKLQKDMGKGNLMIDTQVEGSWTIAYRVCDKAGMFGLGGADNCYSTGSTIRIADTSRPIILLNSAKSGTKPHSFKSKFSENGNAKANLFECGIDTYTEQGARCSDLHDSWDAVRLQWSPAAASYSSPKMADGTVLVNGPVKGEGTYTIKYNCQDARSHPAVQRTRTIRVHDTRRPTVTLKGDHVIENSAGAHKVSDKWEGATGLNVAAMKSEVMCTDSCYANPTIRPTLHYGATCTGSLVGDGKIENFPEYTAGDYSVKYVCKDQAHGGAHMHSICRTIRNVDHTKPVLQILGSDDMTLEATHEGNYIDDGATCSDQVDGVISQNVEVSGDVVNLSKVGTYRITYNCKDSAGNAAPTMTRTVHVKQTSCPTCIITGKSPIQHEASFPYTDAGAACTDIIDGTVQTVVSGNVPVPVGTTGTYRITYRAQNSVGLWNDGMNDAASAKAAGCRGTAVRYVRTVIVQDTLKPVITLHYKNQKVAWSAGGETSSITKATNTIVGAKLMAEQTETTSVNGWVIGAIASAVTGLALLGYSQRKTTVATSVPV